MVSGEFFGSDYFIDSSVSQSVGRAIFGAWVTICVTIIGICARSVYRSRLRRMLLIHGMHHKRKRTLVTPWVISPPKTASEVYEGRKILLWAFSRREFVFILSSLACILVAVITAASTAIANQTVVNNVLTRPTVVRGQLPTSQAQPPLGFATVEMAARIKALDDANFPVEGLLDFVPDDTSGWVYRAADWNNSWRGRCIYSTHRGVDLTIFPTNSTRSQDEVPGLGAFLPSWVSANSTQQQPFHSGIGSDNYTNHSIVWQDMLVTWAYLGQSDSDIFMFNVSLVNFLVDRVGAYPGGGYVETGFRSDVYIASCGFENVNPTLEFQATPGVDPEDAVNNIAWVYELQTEDATLADQPIVQPTGQQMLRYWQAYISILNSQYPHEVKRSLSVSRAVTQIRLSVLATSVGTLLVVLFFALSYQVADLRHHPNKRLMLPGSSFGWVMQAAHEHQHRQGGNPVLLSSPPVFVSQHSGLTLVSGLRPNGQWQATRISSSASKA